MNPCPVLLGTRAQWIICALPTSKIHQGHEVCPAHSGYKYALPFLPSHLPTSDWRMRGPGSRRRVRVAA